MAMPEPVQVTQPFGYDVDGYRPGGFVAPPAQQVPEKLEVPSEPQIPKPQPSPQLLSVSKPEAIPSFTPVQPPPSHQAPLVTRSGNSFYLRQAQQEDSSRAEARKGGVEGCHCVIC
ncbi:hypothetical protein M407DRAFT_174913 [Tulasnella calospora MUT 4182]|uniref:Uncharacterized protein n=1 Tax=Tulasnella calospora MUT 4182 TaxID=1051891 RepID=A0A0C3PRF9_9AGAM|nr:hypothetical protein M407DRAFT_174913 [Tulasnella calospora MUT 4182]